MNLDPSLERDLEAKNTASEREGEANVSRANANNSIQHVIGHMERLKYDVEAVQRSVAANTMFTQSILDNQQTSNARQMELQIRQTEMQVNFAKIDFVQLARMVEALSKIDVDQVVEVCEAVKTMKSGVKVIGWLERPAKFLGTIAVAFSAVFGAGWALYKWWAAK